MQFSSLQVAKTEPLRFNVPLSQFNLDYVVDSGQCFTWDKIDFKHGSAWAGIINNAPVVAVQQPEYLQVYADLPASDVGRYFSLDLKWEEVVKSMVIESEHDEALLTALNHFPGLRVMRQDMWETIASFICSQNSSVATIKKRVGLLRKKFGDQLNRSGQFSFPSPNTVASASKLSLLGCKLGYRARYLRDTARLIASGDFDLQQLKSMDFTEARGYLQELPGVGPKVADCICLFSLGHANAFPIDTHVFQVLTDFYEEELSVLQGGRMHLRYDDLAFFGNKKFGAYCGYSQQYLFHLHRTCREKLENVYA